MAIYFENQYRYHIIINGVAAYKDLSLGDAKMMYRDSIVAAKSIGDKQTIEMVEVIKRSVSA